jgi:CRISPR-associated RAMP protein (TIGR02581 family)
MNHLYSFIGIIELNSALHLGSGREENEIDRLIQRDSKNKPLIPATSIAGVFTTQAQRIAAIIENAWTCAFDLKENEAVKDNRACCICKTCRLFGSANGHASKVTFFDAFLVESKLESSEVRDGVSIKRKTLTARKGAKFTTEVLSKAAQFHFRLDVVDPTDEELNLLLLTLDEFQSGRLSLGGDTTRGLGNFKLQLENVYHVDFSDIEQLISYLKADEITGLPPIDLTEVRNRCGQGKIKIKKAVHEVTAEQSEQEELKHLLPINYCVIDLEFSLLAPTVINQGFIVDLDEMDITFVTSQVNVDGKLTETAYLPGSSLKGVFRSRAEKIIRTLSAIHAQENGLVYEEIVAACDPLGAKADAELRSCGHLFKEIEASRPEPLSWPKLQKRACLACLLFGSTHFAGRIKVIDAYPQTVVNKEHSKKFDHVAIDRFTGGAREGAKFDARLLIHETTPKFYGKLILRDVEPWQLGLIAFVLKDLYFGDIRVGYGKTKGYGKLKGVVRRVEIGTIPGDSLHPYLDEAYGTELDTCTSELYRIARYNLTGDSLSCSQTEKELLKAFASEFVQKVRCFKRYKDMIPKTEEESNDYRQ